MKFSSAFIIFILIVPYVLAVGVGPSTTMLDYLPGQKVTVNMFALNTADRPMRLTIGSKTPLITCSPTEMDAEASSRMPFTCTIEIPDDLPPGMRGLGNIAVTESSQEGGMIGAVGSVVANFRVTVPENGPYLTLGVSVPNTKTGMNSMADITVSNVGTVDFGQLEGTIGTLNANGGTALPVRVFEIPALAKGTNAKLQVPLQTAPLKAGNYRAQVDIPYEGKRAHAEANFKMGEILLTINTLSAADVAAGGVAKITLTLESFWSEAITSNINLRITQEGKEIDQVNDRTEIIQPWQERDTNIFWETGLRPAGVYDVEAIVQYNGKEERKAFPQALRIGAGEAVPVISTKSSLRTVLLFGIGAMILLLIIILIVVLKRKDHEQ